MRSLITFATYGIQLAEPCLALESPRHVQPRSSFAHAACVASVMQLPMGSSLRQMSHLGVFAGSCRYLGIGERCCVLPELPGSPFSPRFEGAASRLHRKQGPRSALLARIIGNTARVATDGRRISRLRYLSLCYPNSVAFRAPSAGLPCPDSRLPQQLRFQVENNGACTHVCAPISF